MKAKKTVTRSGSTLGNKWRRVKRGRSSLSSGVIKSGSEGHFAERLQNRRFLKVSPGISSEDAEETAMELTSLFQRGAKKAQRVAVENHLSYSVLSDGVVTKKSGK